MKGISPIISSVMLIAIVILMAAVIGPWAMKIATDTADRTTDDVNRDLICRNTAYSFDSDYGSSGVDWLFNGTNGTISAKISNTGAQNLYNFSFELILQTPTGVKLVIYPEVNITDDTQRTKVNPLKPGYDWILEAEVDNINDTWSLTALKIINDVCPKISPTVEL
ncbi:MAG: type IV pilin [Candidatus Peribacteraceae bacterium]|nr:type IV pilin [Candidatus Peribacteraceae bacterium]